MTDTTSAGAEGQPGLLKRFWNGGQAIPTIIAFLITVISLPFILPLLPLETPMGILGVAFIYFLVFIMLGLIARMLIGIARKLATLGRKA